MKRLRTPLLVLALAAFAPLGTSARADDGPVRCTCRDGQACWHYLNAPVDPPDDPCHCPQCRIAPGSCPKRLPEDWDPVCADNSRMECFLRRHAASWHISCSARLEGDCDCKTPHPEWCPMCGKNGHEWDAEGLEVIRRQVGIESRLFGNPRRFMVAKSPHFYLVTNIRSLKILTQQGSPRIMRMHELVHVYLERAEVAYEDFTNALGSRVSLPKPMAIYLVDKARTKEDVQAAYFGSPRTNIIYGGGSTSIAGGYPFNGFAASEQETGDDHTLHLVVRHSIGHILMSCWVQVNGQDKYLPTWVYAGAGHWLARMPEKLSEMATFCADEGTALSDSGKRWDQKARKIALDRNAPPIQRVFDVNAMSALDLDMHIMAWSWFKIFLEEDRDRFVAFLTQLRKGVDHRIALKEAFGCSPEEFQERWRERVLGKRPTVAPTAAELDASNPDRPGAKERAGIRNETDLPTLAARIRALQAVNDPLTASTVVPMLNQDSELVRETIVLVLSRTKSAEVKEWLRTEGLGGNRGVARAYVARVLAELKDEAAGPELMKYVGDGFWLTRAHVARALGMIKYEPGKETLKDMVSDRSPKVRIAAMDALANFGELAASAWEPVSDELGDSHWQVRSAATDCLGALGDMHAVEPLIARMEIESGRVRKDIREALKKITRDDLGNDPKYWREWWEKEKERAGGNLPPRGEKPKEPPKGEHEYGDKPTYYGLQVFSEGVGYVLDVSSSMLSTIKIDPGWLARNRREYPPVARKFDLARNEIEASLKTLDPRVRFNLYFFRSDAFTWKGDLQPASRSNVDSAVGRMASEEPKPPPPPRPGRPAASGNRNQTNYVDAFRLVLDVDESAATDGGFGDTPDTIYFLTDGTPTAGDITDTEVLNSWFRELNRFARVKVNVITFGNLGVDREFLKNLAENNDGVFVQVPAVQ